MAISNPSPERFAVLSFVGAGEDLLFWEKVDLKIQRTRDAVLGEPHWDRVRYPNHQLVYKTPLDSSGQWHKFFYAADRQNQEAYNFEFTGDQLSRSFLVPRSKYYARTEAQASIAVPQIEEEFTRPVVGTPDVRFPDFVYAEDSLSRTDTELDSIYILVRQIYSPERLVTYQWDDVLQRVIKVTRQVVAAKTERGSGDYGVQVEIQPNNIFNDFKITSEVQWLPEDLDSDGNPNYPIQIDSVASDANYQFPLLLKSIKIFGAWASAYSEAPPDYAEDFFFENDLIEPSPGPYSATILRFITNNPDQVRALYPTTQIATRAETFGIIKWWAVAHSKGNRAFALARQYNSPASVHDVIELPNQVNYVQGGSHQDSNVSPGSKTMPATPGYSAYRASTTTIAGVDTRRSRLGLWEVQITIIEAGGATVYQDDESSSRIVYPGTGTGIMASQPIIELNSLYISPKAVGSESTPSITSIAGTYKVWVSGKIQAVGDFYDPIKTAPNITWSTNASWISSSAPNPFIQERFMSRYYDWDDPMMFKPYDFIFNYSANNTGAARTGTITFKNGITGEKKICTITQPA